MMLTYIVICEGKQMLRIIVQLTYIVSAEYLITVNSFSSITNDK